MKRLRAALDRAVPDMLAITGWLLLALGAGNVPGGWGAVLAPVVLGVGLLVTVRYGARS